MSVKFFKSGSNVNVVSLNDELVSDTLRAAVYVLNYNDMQGYYLTYDKDSFELPPKIYGNSHERTEKVLKTYQDSEKSVGVLLSGNKGTGKTLTSSLIANTMISENVPVIIINQPFQGNGFTKILNDIGECVVFFDEFGKVYDKDEDQANLLTLFDGVSSQKRLFLITENETHRINEFFLCRPSRIHYHFSYGKLTDDVIEAYCLDEGIDETASDSIKTISCQMLSFSFDMLQTITQEYKRFGGDVEELVKDLNVGYSPEITSIYEVLEFTRDGVPIKLREDQKIIHTGKKHVIPVHYTAVDNDGDEYECYESFSLHTLVFQRDNQLLYKSGSYSLKVRKLDTQQTTYAF